ncbi:MAG: T9SS type A sorting domain-containing protein [Saprospiraceae bacterium]|nr:T9SS type A sorting domain-containing protein [Saprospiraceae bacterium]
MKAILQNKLQLILCLLLCSTAIIGQDLSIISFKSMPAQIYLHRPIVFQLVIINQGPEPVPGFIIEIKVSNQDNGRMVFEKTYMMGFLSGFSTTTLLTNADLFYLNREEAHLASAEIIFDGDPGPTNNYAQFEFTPESLGIQLTSEQWNSSSPTNPSIYPYGAIGFKLPKSLFQLIKNPLIQIACGKNENLLPCFYNFPFPPMEERDVWIPINYTSADFVAGELIQDLQLSILITDYTWSNQKLPWFDFIENTCHQLNTSAYGGNWISPTADPPLVKTPVSFTNNMLPDLNYQSGIVGLDLNALAPKTNPCYSGDNRASGPAAASNGLMSLINKHPDELDNGLQQREILELISRDALRRTASGITVKQFIESKLNLLDNLCMPLGIEYQWAQNTLPLIMSPQVYQRSQASNAYLQYGDLPSFDFIKTKISAGASVELIFGYYDNNNQRLEGSWANVCGILDHPSFHGIYIHLDIDDQNAGGHRIFYSHLKQENSKKWSRLVSFENLNYACWLEAAVSQEFKPGKMFNPIPLTTFRNIHLSGPLQSYQLSGTFRLFIPASEMTEQAYVNIFAQKESGAWVWLSRAVPLAVFDNDYKLDNPFSYQRLDLNAAQLKDKLLNVYVDYGRDVNSYNSIIPHWKLKKNLVYKIQTKDIMIKYNPVSGDGDDHSDHTTGSPLPDIRSSAVADSVYRGCKVDNLDLDSSRHRPNSSMNTQGDWNACAPTAAANSMQWLEGQFPDKIKTNLSLREKMEELSRLMKRPNEQGVLTDSFILGKLAFIDKYKLPIKVKFQRCCHWPIEDIRSPDSLHGHSARNDNDTMKPFRLRWDWLVREMKAGEDVELEFVYKDIKKDSVVGAHMVTATGIKIVGDQRGFWYKDDERQDTVDGTGESFVHWENDSMGYVYVPELSDSCVRTYVTSMISESYDSTVVFYVIAVDDLERSGIRVWPNPVECKTQLNIQLNESWQGIVQWRLIDFAGRVNSSGKMRSYINNYRLSIPTTDLIPGNLYLLQLIHDKQFYAIKIFVTH